jgi:hypothetical protein
LHPKLLAGGAIRNPSRSSVELPVTAWQGRILGVLRLPLGLPATRESLGVAQDDRG